MPQVDQQANSNAGAPSLDSICNLYRSIINDTFGGGGGQINTDQSSWMIPFLNSSIEDLYADLGIVGDMRLIKDNVIVSGIPAVPAGDPSVQVGVTYTGVYSADWSVDQPNLPGDLLYLKRLWQRPTDSSLDFRPMFVAAAGLPSRYQGNCMGDYEVRGNNEIWTNGALLTTDYRLRYEAEWQEIASETVDFPNMFVPIKGSCNAIAFKMVAYYAQRLSPDQFELAESQAMKFTKKLITKSVLNAQVAEFEREGFENQHY